MGEPKKSLTVGVWKRYETYDFEIAPSLAIDLGTRVRERQRASTAWYRARDDQSLLDDNRQLGRFSHLHNSYLHAVVVIGLLLLVRRLVQARKAGIIPYQLFYFVVGTVALYAVASIVQIRINDMHGNLVAIILGSVMLACTLKKA